MVKFVNIVNIALLRRFWSNVKSWIINNMVAKEEGKGLSSNDFTDGERNNLNQALEKLDTIEEGAQKNVPPDWTAIQNKPFGAEWATGSAINYTGEWEIIYTGLTRGKVCYVSVYCQITGERKNLNLGTDNVEHEANFGGITIGIKRNETTVYAKCTVNSAIGEILIAKDITKLDPIFLPESLESTIADLTARIEALESANA